MIGGIATGGNTAPAVSQGRLDGGLLVGGQRRLAGLAEVWVVGRRDALGTLALHFPPQFCAEKGRLLSVSAGTDAKPSITVCLRGKHLLE